MRVSLTIAGRIFSCVLASVAIFCATACGQSNQKDPKIEESSMVSEVASPEPSTLVGRTEAAILDQISCRQPPNASLAVRAMLRNDLIEETNDGSDGSIVFVPKKSLTFLGFPIKRITGWQANPEGDAMPPFFRGPGTAPPSFFSITVKGSPADIRKKALAHGLREAKYVDDPDEEPIVIQGETTQPQKKIAGFEIEGGDMSFVETPLNGVATISCSMFEYD